MDQEDRPKPTGAADKASSALSPEKLARKQRLAEALRANLRRRKAQIRQRRAEADEESGPQQA